MPDSIACDPQMKPAKPEVLSPTLNQKWWWQFMTVFHKIKLLPLNHYHLRYCDKHIVFPGWTHRRTTLKAVTGDGLSSCSIIAVRIQSCVLKQLPKHAWCNSFTMVLSFYGTWFNNIWLTLRGGNWCQQAVWAMQSIHHAGIYCNLVWLEEKVQGKNYYQ